MNKIILGDCLEVMKNMSDNCVDITITSPPYNIGVRHKKYLDYEDNDINYHRFIFDVINELLRITRYYIFFNVQNSSVNNCIAFKIQEIFEKNINELFIWAKNNPVPKGSNQNIVANGYEYIFCLTKNKFRFRVFERHNMHDAKISNCIISSVNNNKDSDIHKAIFPNWLPYFFINNFSKKNDIVLDCFGGVGTSALASIELGRRYIYIDRSKEYYNVARKRIKDAENQLALF